jgi:hypothetical protein
MYTLGSSTTDDDDVVSPRNNNNNNNHIPSSMLCDETLLEVVTCHDLVYKPNEKSVTIRLKSLISKGEIQEGEELLASLQQTDDEKEKNDSSSKKKKTKSNKDTFQNGLKLRTFLPLVEHYCEIGDAESIFRLYHTMQNTAGVYWDVDSYTLVVSSLARFGYFKTSSVYGPTSFHEIATDVARDLLELTPEAANILEAAFREGFNDDESNGSEIIGHVEIPSNGLCPTTGVKLRLLALDDTQREHVHDTLLVMARLSGQEFVASVKERNNNSGGNRNQFNGNLVADDHGFESLSNFSNWLE